MIIELEDVVKKLEKENPHLDRNAIIQQIESDKPIMEFENSTALRFGGKRVDENLVDLLIPTWVTDLEPYRQTSCINFRGMIDSFKSQGVDIKSDIVTGIQQHDSRFSETYLMDTSNWTDLGAFIRMQEIVKEKTGDPNPRQFMQHGLYSGFMKTVLDMVDVLLKVSSVQVAYELLPNETRKANYDLIIQYLSTEKEGKKRTSRFNMKYFDNFKGDIPIDHKWWVISIISGLAKRKKKDFAKAHVQYFEEDLMTVLSRDYAYMGWKVERNLDGEVTINGDVISRQVAFQKVVEPCSIHPISKLGMKYSYVKEREIYDPHHVELNFFNEGQLQEGLKTKDLVIGDLVVEDRADRFHHIIRKGEKYGLPTTLVDFCYSTQKGGDDSGFKDEEVQKKTFAEWFTGIGRKEEERARLQIRTLEAIKQAELAKVAYTNELNLRENLELIVEARTAALREAQAQLVQDAKLKSLGKVTAGVSHEINNPMTGVKSGTEQVIKELRKKDQVYQTLTNHLSLNSPTEKDRIIEDIKTIGKKSYVFALENQRISTREVRQRKKEYIPLLEEVVKKDADSLAKDCVKMGLNPSDLQQILDKNDSETFSYIFSCLKSEYQIGAILNTVLTSTNRILDVTSALKRHSHLDQGKVGKVDVIQSIEDTLTILKETINDKGIQIERDYQEVPILTGYPAEIGDVWMNLVYNAHQAVDQGGKVKISVKDSPEYIIVMVNDNGKGIPEDIKEKIFDPFFTTKDQGEGSGLGLGNCLNAVKKHGGKIDVYSRLGDTSFEVYLSKKNVENSKV